MLFRSGLSTPQGQIGLKLHHPGRHDGQPHHSWAHPRTRAPGTPGQGRAGLGCRWRGQGPLSDKSPTKIKKGPFRDRVPLSGRSCHLRRGGGGGRARSPDPESRAGTWSSEGRPPHRPSPPPVRVPSARGAFLLLRPPPEIWGCAPGGPGCRGPLTLSGGGNCS